MRSVQDWEAGVNVPGAERLRALVRALLEAGAFTPGREILQASDLWNAALREAPRARTPFDEQWFAQLLATQRSNVPGPATQQFPSVVSLSVEPERLIPEHAIDWGDAPDTLGFVGRADELAVLQHWVVDERCRLVALLGMGGIGKTSLAARLAETVAPNFARLYWRSLRNAPPVTEWLAGAISFLSDQQVIPASRESDRIDALLQILRTKRCLIVLDNSETLLEPGQREGRYRPGMDGYGRVLEALGQASHQSCLVLTSREAPPELSVLGGGVRALVVQGLGSTDAQAMLSDKDLIGDTEAWLNLVGRYGGNGLALKIVSETIQQVYDGDLGTFLADASGANGTVLGGVRRLLDEQVNRLSSVELHLLWRLAIEREPISPSELMQETAPTAVLRTVLESIETLRRRSLVERGDRGASFTLQSMVLEYVTERLVETAVFEIDRARPVLLVEQPLIKAQAKDYVRETQERLIAAPILRRLTAQYASAGTESRLLALLERWREGTAVEQGYGPGNVVNMLRLLRGDLRAIDLSCLNLQQIYLQGVDAQDASLASSELSGVVLDEPFAYPTAAALSADGNFLAAGTPAGDVRLWRTADRTLLLAVRGHSGMVWGVSVSDDGRLLASGGDDGLVRLWNATTGQVLCTLQAHVGPVWGVVLSADGRLTASGGEDGLVRLWETDSGQLIASLQGHTGAVRSVALSGDLRLVASGGDDMSVRIWEVKTGRLLATLQGHTGVVYGLAISGDGGRLVSGSVDGTVRLWDPASGQLLTTLEAHPGGLRGVALSADGRLAASGGGDGLVRLWDAEAGRLLANMPGHTGAVWCMALSSDGQFLASGSQDGTIRLWNAASGQLQAVVQGQTGVILSTALLDAGQLVASGGVDGVVRVWSWQTEHLLATLRGHTGLVRGVGLSADARLAASAGDDGLVRFWEPRTGELLAALEGHTGTVWSMALSSEGSRLVSGGVDNTVRLWDSETRQLLATLRGHGSLVWGVAISRDGSLAASASLDGTVRLWDAESVQLLDIQHSKAGAVWGVTLSGDGQLVACGCVDGTVKLWETRNSQDVATLHGHSGLAYAVTLSDDGRLLASGGADGLIQLWETATGQLLTTLRGHTGVVWSVALSADGRMLASGGDDGILRIWDTANGACVRTLRADRPYERMDIAGLTGITDAQRAALVALGAIEHEPAIAR
jgi:WD40 repeat protein